MKATILFRQYVLSFGMLLTSSAICYAGETSEGESVSNEILQSLGKSFQDLGSFQADYELSGKEKKAKLQLFQNTKKKYVVVLLDDDQGKTPPTLFLVTYREDKLKGREFQFVMGKPPELQTMTISVWKVVEHPLSPVTALVTITNALKEKDPGLAESLPLKDLYPSTSLGLTRKDVIIGIGITSSSIGPSAMWLDQKWYKDAEKIEPDADTVRVSFTEGHEVLLDLKSGLLKKDHGPWDPMLSSRHLTLIKYSPMDPDKDLEDLIPGYSEMNLKPAPATGMNRQVMQAALLSLNLWLSTIPDLKSLIDQDSSAIKDRIRMAACLETRKAAKMLVADFPNSAGLLQNFHMLHERYQKDHPKAQIDFRTFTDNWLRVMTENPSASPMNKVAVGIKKNYDETLRGLPLDESAPVRTLYNKFIEAYLDGWRIELTKALIDKAFEAENTR
ncbi:MAG: hypothetical protein PF495_16135 [Spirochaetales bacterium]|nr:hypothetical protein [Spirochaetales bacterium]